MNIALIGVVEGIPLVGPDGAVALARIRSFVEARLPRAPILLQAVPLAHLVAGVRLSVTALSYDGQFAVSLLADDNMPDLPVLAAGVRTAFEGFMTRAAHLD